MESNLNLVRSHAVGVGENKNTPDTEFSCISGEPLTPEVTRLLLTNQINGFCLGYKGVTRGTVEKCLAALNANCLPVVPTKGTVGSHDFAQLRNVFNNDPESGLLGVTAVVRTSLIPRF